MPDLTTMRHPGIAFRRWRSESPSTRDPRLVWYLLRRRGIRGFIGQKHLGDDFFDLHLGLQPGYSELAQLVSDWAQPESVCDMGCGNGFMLSAFAQQGLEVLGVDSSEAVLRYVDESIRDRIAIRDLSQPQDLGRFDLVVSTGVAEHLPKRHAHAFVENIARHAKQRVFFAAAVPGQWGDGHINCQPHEYWIELFKEQGLDHDPGASERLTEAAAASTAISEALPWIFGIIMMFDRPH